MILVDADKFLSYLIYSKYIDGLTCGEVKEAIEMCKVNVLNASVEDDDCIRREAVLNALYALCDTGENLKENPWRDNPHIDAVVETIEQLPTVKPKERTGEWQQDMDGTFLCSECGSGYEDQPTLMGKPMFAFCPICGVRMKKGEEHST